MKCNVHALLSLAELIRLNRTEMAVPQNNLMAGGVHLPG